MPFTVAKINKTLLPNNKQEIKSTTDSMVIEHTTKIVQKSIKITNENVTLIKSEHNSDKNNFLINLKNNQKIDKLIGEKKEIKKFDEKFNTIDKVFGTLNFKKHTSSENSEEIKTNKNNTKPEKGQFIFYAENDEIGKIKRKLIS